MNLPGHQQSSLAPLPAARTETVAPGPRARDLIAQVSLALLKWVGRLVLLAVKGVLAVFFWLGVGLLALLVLSVVVRTVSWVFELRGASTYAPKPPMDINEMENPSFSSAVGTHWKVGSHWLYWQTEPSPVFSSDVDELADYRCELGRRSFLRTAPARPESIGGDGPRLLSVWPEPVEVQPPDSVLATQVVWLRLSLRKRGDSTYILAKDGAFTQPLWPRADGALMHLVESGHAGFACLDHVSLRRHFRQPQWRSDGYFCAAGLDLQTRQLTMLDVEQVEGLALNPQPASNAAPGKWRVDVRAGMCRRVTG